MIEVNELQKRRTIGKLQKHLGSLVGKEIALLGLAFKPDTDDMRDAPSLVLAARLRARARTCGSTTRLPAESAARGAERGAMCDSAEAVVDGADAAVLVTEWPRVPRARRAARSRRA